MCLHCSFIHHPFNLKIRKARDIEGDSDSFRRNLVEYRDWSILDVQDEVDALFYQQGQANICCVQIFRRGRKGET